MAERERRSDSQPPLASAAIILVALLTGVALYDRPLTSSRPRAPVATDAPTNGEASRVPARLWQDPLGAIAGHERPHHEGADGSAASLSIAEVCEVGARLDERFGVNLVALPILVERGMLPAAIESRTRDRYAVVSALGRAGFVPWEDESLHYFDYHLGGGAAAARTRIAFEWFVEEARPRARHSDPCARWPKSDDECNRVAVLVLWIEDEALLPDALGGLTKLFAELSCGLRAPLDVRVIGPRKSGSLLRLVDYSDKRPPREACERSTVTSITQIGAASIDGDAGPRHEVSPPLHLFSPWVTIGERVLDEKLGSDARRRARLLEERGALLTRTTTSDDELAEVIVEELERRDVHLGPLGDPPAEVAIVGEWDTVYGRAFASSLERAIQERVEDGRGRVRAWEWIHEFTYLRGLDGTLPPQGKAGAKKEGAGGEAAEGGASPADDEDVPQGNGQLDYLRRLARRIEATNASRLRRCSIVDRITDGCRKIRAIGIVGSDVHDKLLVLQALKPLFPDAIFFTTDLDAMLAHESQLAWSRNLLVVSPFGLELAPKLQRSTPPFRDSYQTAVYYAVLQAVGFSPGKQRHGLYPGARRSGPILVPTPRIFEIGRYGPVDITVVADPARASVHPDRIDIGDPSTRSPGEKIGSFLRNAALWAVVCIVGSALLVPVLSTRAARYQHVETSRLMFLLVLVLGAAGLFVVISFFQGSAGEPFEVLSGVSVWPTEILRFYVVLLSSYLSFRVFQQIDTNQKSMETGFELPQAHENEPFRKTLQGLLAARGARIRASLAARLDPSRSASPVAGPPPSSRLTTNEIWRQYARREPVRSRLARVATATVFLVVLGYALMALFGHARVPARQYVTFQIDRWILSVMIFTVSFLHCLVLDATSSCDRWVMRLGSAGDDPGPSELVRRMRLIEARTAVVGRFVYYPLVCAVLAVVSRSTLFDEWRTPPGLIAIFGLLGVYTVICSWILVRSANAARREALALLRRRRWETITTGAASSSSSRNAIEAATEFIDGMRDGAFAPLAQHPILGAVLLPAGSFGLLSLLDMLQRFR